MDTILGTGEFRYRLVSDWARLPDGWDFYEVAAVAVDRKDQVYVFSRSEHPVTVFDRDGKFLRSWGEGIFKRPHGLSLAPDGTLSGTPQAADLGANSLVARVTDSAGFVDNAEVRVFEEGVSADNVEAFLAGVDIYVDGIDFFEIDARRLVFMTCRQRGIYALTAAPLGFGATVLAVTQGEVSEAPTHFQDRLLLVAPPLLFLAAVLLLGLYLPPPLRALLEEATALLEVSR